MYANFQGELKIAGGDERGVRASELWGRSDVT